ncbi:hypothetical protein [Agromyces soli]|uniref:ABC transporter n=1 Tax=Agromyces soli TaxID=659012 RepID=A0ABY4AN20_9MICO|nr:hypothetical protein [Agromyces soli]UOE24551.1 hypothetical protein MTP13_09165 [Agromyces soli]
MTSTTPGDDEPTRASDDSAANADLTPAARGADTEHPTAVLPEPVATTGADASQPASPAEEPESPADEAAADDTAHDASPAPEPASAALGEAPGVIEEPEPASEDLDANARLDAAVQRAGVVPGGDAPAEEYPEPVAADTVRRETYVPAGAAAGTAAGAATLAPEPGYAAGPQTVYVQAPEPPKAKGNRGFGILVALIGTVLFAALYLGAAYLLLLSQGDAGSATEQLTQFAAKQLFWVPVAVFFLGFALLAAIVNKGGWWCYAVFGLLVAVAVYFSYVGGALWSVAWTITPGDVPGFVAQRWLDPFAIVAAVIAREIPIWLGGWIAARGRKVTERNRLALEAYDREIAAGPQAQPR